MRVNHGRGFSAPAIRFARMFALVGRLEVLLMAGGFFLSHHLFVYSGFSISILKSPLERISKVFLPPLFGKTTSFLPLTK